jgi:hypothetical protein
MKYNPLDNYSMEEIERMLQNVIEIEEFGTDVQHVILIADDFDELHIDMSSPEEPNAASLENHTAHQRNIFF